jgi:hypothetical protein
VTMRDAPMSGLSFLQGQFSKVRGMLASEYFLV